MKKAARSRERGFTYGDYCSWPEDERWEIINGVALDMTPAPGTLHQQIVGNLFGLLWSFFREKPCQVFISPFDVRLPAGEQADEEITDVVQPDIVVVCDPMKIDDKGCRGAPDLVVEVISPSTASRDHLEKRRLYERQGVKEFWLVHPVDRIVMLFHLGPDGRYQAFEAGDAETVVKPGQFPGLEIDFSQVFPPPVTRVVKDSPRAFAPGRRRNRTAKAS